MIPTLKNVWSSPDSRLLFVEFLALGEYRIAIYDSRNGNVWEVSL